MHGWGSRATAMLGIAKQFIRAGAEVVLYDGPGSGLTEAPISLLPHSWQVMEDLEQQVGPFDVVVGHSFAGITAAHVLAAGKLPSCKALVTIGSPNSLEDLTELVLRDRGIPVGFLNYFNEQSRRLAGKPMSELGIVAALSELRAGQLQYLCLHDYEDKEVPVAHADEIERALAWAKVERTSGLGHNRILNDAELQARVRRFADGALLGA
ncbi:MAG: alpha/beta fold hydrolase [Sulfitobacter sp.]|nr:alpha/beta fold hydrolase [Sulfitobacter sp.]